MSILPRFVPALISLAIASTALSARAQSSDPITLAQNLDEEARAVFEAGEHAYRGGRFVEAIDYFDRAYNASRRPWLLCNIGRVAMRLERYARALAAFEECRARSSDLPEPTQRELAVMLPELRRRVERERYAEADDYVLGAGLGSCALGVAGVSVAEADTAVHRDHDLRLGVGSAAMALLFGGCGAALTSALFRAAIDDPPARLWLDIFTGLGGILIAAVAYALLVAFEGGDDTRFPVDDYGP